MAAFELLRKKTRKQFVSFPTEQNFVKSNFENLMTLAAEQVADFADQVFQVKFAYQVM